MRIIFIRHGDPDYSIDSLTKKGRREAELLAQRVSRWKIDSIYCSPLGRAQATAAYSLEKLGRTAVTKEFLREFRGHVYNPYNGLDHISWDLMPDYWTQSETMYDKDNWTSDPIIKGSRDDIAAEWKMVQDGIDEIIAANGYTRKGRYYTFKEHSDNTVVIFCHFGVTMVMMSHILGIAPPVMLHGLFLPPTSVTVLNTEERVPGEAYFRCQVIGDVTHLHMGGEPVSASGYFSELLQEDYLN